MKKSLKLLHKRSLAHYCTMNKWLFANQKTWAFHTHTHTHTFNGPLSGTTRVSRSRKAKPIWILLKQETVSGSGISWAICKSAPCSRQINTPAPHHSVFLQARCPSCRPTNSVKALKALHTHTHTQQINIQHSYKNHFRIIYRIWSSAYKRNINGIKDSKDQCWPGFKSQFFQFLNLPVLIKLYM